MALEFRKRRFRMPGKKMQIFLTALALLLALSILFSWLIISYRLDKAKEDKNESTGESSALVKEEYTREDDMHILLMLTDAGYERFTLLQASPATSALRIVPIPETLSVSDAQTLVSVLRKNGAAAATQAVAAALQLPLRQYIAMTGEEAEKWFNYLESGITVSLPEAVDHLDENGTILRLDSGEHTLTATQTVALIRYTGWQSMDATRRFDSEILCAMFQKYFHSQRRFSADFTRLANGSSTSLRISDYNAHQEAIRYLASLAQEDAACVQVVMLSGEHTETVFYPDLKKIQSETALYK